jgi:hypothetical protein
MGNDGAFSKRGSMRSKRLLAFAALCVAVTAIGLSPTSDAGAMLRQKQGSSQAKHRFSFPAVKVHGRVVTFRLRGVAPNSIRFGYVKRGHRKRGLSLHRVRAAARRGVLRLHMAGARAGHHGHHLHRKAADSRHRKTKKPTLIVVTKPPPPTPSPAPKPAPGPAPGPAASWRAVGSPPLSDGAAKALVTPRAEIRPANATANHYIPSGLELAAFHAAGSFNPLEKYVSGGFAGTTDEILQWGAHKWGIPEDVMRAVAVTESWWRQDAMGDRQDGVNAALYPVQSQIDAHSVYETLGLMQVKWRPDQSLHPGTEPLRWKSTSFNVDYWGASVRYYYDGLCNWCGSGYGPGQDWNSVGAWFSPSPWGTSQRYVTQVKGHLAARTWERPGF